MFESFEKKINVVIPCFNYGIYLDICLLSVFVQKTNFKIEVLLSDDNSTDDSVIIAKRFAERYNNDIFTLKIFQHDKNIGELSNTKFLLNQCDGDYIAYMDADDYWLDPYKLQKQFDYMENNSDSSCCFTGYLIHDGKNFIPSANLSPFIGVPSAYQNGGLISSETLCEKNFVTSSSRFFRNYKNLFQEYFDNFPYSDWPLNFELSLRGNVVYFDYASYVYRVKENSLSSVEINKPSSNEIDFSIVDKRINILKKRLSEVR